MALLAVSAGVGVGRAGVGLGCAGTRPRSHRSEVGHPEREADRRNDAEERDFADVAALPGLAESCGHCEDGQPQRRELDQQDARQQGPPVTPSPEPDRRQERRGEQDREVEDVNHVRRNRGESVALGGFSSERDGHDRLEPYSIKYVL